MHQQSRHWPALSHSHFQRVGDQRCCLPAIHRSARNAPSTVNKNLAVNVRFQIYRSLTYDTSL